MKEFVISQSKTERAVLVGLITQQQNEQKTREYLDELAFLAETAGAEAEIAALPDIVCRGGSNVIDPYGHAVTDTLWDCEGVLYADLDMQKVPASRMEHDVCGHYARPDVLDLRVREG